MALAAPPSSLMPAAAVVMATPRAEELVELPCGARVAAAPLTAGWSISPSTAAAQHAARILSLQLVARIPVARCRAWGWRGHALSGGFDASRMFEVTNSSLIIGADADDPDGDSSGARFQYIPCYYEWPVPEPAAISERGKAAPWCRVWLPECIADRSSPPSRCRVQRLINGGTYLQAVFYLTATAPVSSLLAAAAGLDGLAKGKGKKGGAPSPASSDPASLACAAPGDKISMTWSVADAMMERMMRCDEPDTDEAMAHVPAKPAAAATAASTPAAGSDAAAAGAGDGSADAGGGSGGRAAADADGAASSALTISGSVGTGAHSRSLADVRTSSAWMQCLKWAGFVARRLIGMPSPRLRATRVPQTCGEVMAVISCSPELRTLCRGLLSQSVEEQPDPMLLHQALEHAVAATAAHHFPRISPGNKARVARQLEGVSAILKKLMLASGKSCACGKCVFESFSSYAFGLALVSSLHPPGDLPSVPARVSFDRPACAWSCRSFDDGYAAVRWSGLMGGEVGVEDVRAMLDTAVDRVRRMVRLVDDTRECGGTGGGGTGGSGSGTTSAGGAPSSPGGAGAAASAAAAVPVQNVERGIDFVATLSRVVMVTVRDALTVYARVYPRFLSTLVAEEALAEPPPPGSAASTALTLASSPATAAAAVGGAGDGSSAIVPASSSKGTGALKGDAEASGKASGKGKSATGKDKGPASGASDVDALPGLDAPPTTLAELAAQLTAAGAASCGDDHHGHHHDGHRHLHHHHHHHYHDDDHVAGAGEHGSHHHHGHDHDEHGRCLHSAVADSTGTSASLKAGAPGDTAAAGVALSGTAIVPAAAPAPLALPDMTNLPPSALRLLQREVERLTRRKVDLAREAATLARAHSEYAALADADAAELARVEGDIRAVRIATVTAATAADAAERRYEGFRARIAEADLHRKELDAIAKACAASKARLEGTLDLRDALRGELDALRVLTSTTRESTESHQRATRHVVGLAAGKRAQAAALKAATARPATHDKDMAALKRAAEAAEAAAAAAVAREAAAQEEAATLKARIASLRSAPSLQVDIDTARASAASSRDTAAAAVKAKAAADAARAAAREKAAGERAALEQRRAAALRASEALRRQMGAAEAELGRLKEGMIAAATARDAAIAAAMALLGGAGAGPAVGGVGAAGTGSGTGTGAGVGENAFAGTGTAGLHLALPTLAFSSDTSSGSGSGSLLSASAPAFTLPGHEDEAAKAKEALASLSGLGGLGGLHGFSFAGLTGLGGAGDGASSASTLQALQTLQALAGAWPT